MVSDLVDLDSYFGAGGPMRKTDKTTIAGAIQTVKKNNLEIIIDDEGNS